MSPYDIMNSLPRSVHAETADHRAKFETPVSILISSGAYRSVNAIERWVDNLKSRHSR